MSDQLSQGRIIENPDKILSCEAVSIGLESFDGFKEIGFDTIPEKLHTWLFNSLKYHEIVVSEGWTDKFLIGYVGDKDLKVFLLVGGKYIEEDGVTIFKSSFRVEYKLQDNDKVSRYLLSMYVDPNLESPVYPINVRPTMHQVATYIDGILIHSLRQIIDANTGA